MSRREEQNITELTQQVIALSQQLLGTSGDSGGGMLRAVYADVAQPRWVVEVRVNDAVRTKAEQVLVAQDASLTAALLSLRHALGAMLRGERPVMGGEV